MEYKIHRNSLSQPLGFDVPDFKPPVFKAPSEISGIYCQLTKLNPETDSKELYEAFMEDTSGRNWTYLPYGPFLEFSEFYTWMSDQDQKSDPCFYTLNSTKTGQKIGIASYLRISPPAASIEVGHIHISERGKHSTAFTEAMYLMAKYAFRLGFRRYEWKCDILNTPSVNAATRLGFTYEGCFRQMSVTKGRNRDTAWFSICDQEWPELASIYSDWLNPTNFDTNGNQKSSLSSKTGPILKSRFPEAYCPNLP